MSFVESELTSQVGSWRAAAELAGWGGLGLPEPGERISVAGCGTSRFMAQAYARCREAAGHGWSDAFAASEHPDRPYDAVVVLSRSGTTTEVVDLMERLRDRTPETRVVALTADDASPVAQLATHPVVLSHASERSVVQTRFATTSLALLRAALGEDLRPVFADGEKALAAPLPASPGTHGHLVFVGLGWAAGLADEAALKCRESAGAWTESYAAMEYRHGPISVVTSDSLVWSLGPAPAGLDGEIAALGGTVVTSDLDPMAELVRAQRYAVALAQAGGRDPDRPRGLAFSVVLGDPGSGAER